MMGPTASLGEAPGQREQDLLEFVTNPKKYKQKLVEIIAAKTELAEVEGRARDATAVLNTTKAEAEQATAGARKAGEELEKSRREAASEIKRGRAALEDDRAKFTAESTAAADALQRREDACAEQEKALAQEKEHVGELRRSAEAASKRAIEFQRTAAQLREEAASLESTWRKRVEKLNTAVKAAMQEQP